MIRTKPCLTVQRERSEQVEFEPTTFSSISLSSPSFLHPPTPSHVLDPV